jgi:hypothetical protein
VWEQLKTTERDNYVGEFGSRAAENLLELAITWVKLMRTQLKIFENNKSQG